VAEEESARLTLSRWGCGNERRLRAESHGLVGHNYVASESTLAPPSTMPVRRQSVRPRKR